MKERLEGSGLMSVAVGVGEGLGMAATRAATESSGVAASGEGWQH